MNISCNNCGKVHSVSDEKMKDKRVYFFCSSCRHKIVVDSRTQVDEYQPPVFSYTSFTDIFRGLFQFFNWTGLLVSALHMILVSLLLGITGKTVYVHALFFFQHKALLVMLGLLVFLIVIYSRSLVLYYLSRIQTFKFQNPGKIQMNWKNIHFDFGEDWLTLLVCSGAPVLVLFLLSVPLYNLRSFGIFFSGLFYPVIFLLVLSSFLFFLLFRYVPAIVSAGSYFVRDGLEEILSFIKEEFVELPFYSIVITVITKFFGFLFLSIFSSVTALSASFIFFFLSGEGKDAVLKMISTLPTLSSVKGVVPSYVSLGGVILFIMIFLSGIMFLAFLDNMIQSLYMKAVIIMKQNPRESFNRYAMLGIFAVIIFCILLGVLIILNIPTPGLPVFVQKVLGV